MKVRLNLTCFSQAHPRPDAEIHSIHSKGAFHVSVSEKPLHIDIPVKLADVKVVFSVGALAFEGDLPASMFHLQLIENDIADWNAKSQVIAVFHTNAGHVTLHDIAYNADRSIATGNPYKGLVADLMKRGAQIELCGATAKAHKWGNADLLPGIKVNTDAMARTTQLVQEGFVKISE
jgi:intracellular sulfur oxidation DsrE/DsrF family protein